MFSHKAFSWSNTSLCPVVNPRAADNGGIESQRPDEPPRQFSTLHRLRDQQPDRASESYPLPVREAMGIDHSNLNADEPRHHAL